MGILFSACDTIVTTDENMVGCSISNQIFRQEKAVIQQLVDCYILFQYPPVMDYIGLCTFVQNATQRFELNSHEQDLVQLGWHIFSFQTVYGRLPLPFLPY